jgi:alpha-ketoglutarate-dependent taurine dioxygenase
MSEQANGLVRRTRGPAAARPRVHRQALDDEPFVLCVEANLPGLDLAFWLAENAAQVHADLDKHGAVLFRGFADGGPEGFAAAARAVSPDLLGYLERAAPRVEVADHVFTSTEFPADQWIPLHHEMSYSHNWPSRLYFYCAQPPATGGATPLASERRVFPRIPGEIKDRFTRHGVRYVRNFSSELDLPWQEVFQTNERAEAEAYCRAAGMRFEWLGADRLRTTAVRQAVAAHPRTGEQVWFNHAHLFHVSNLPPAVSAALLAEVGVEGLPRNAFYGNGDAIPDEIAGLIRDLYRDAALSVPWQRGDVLLVDNFLAVHGREPFSGDRRICVAMSDLYAGKPDLCTDGDTQ